MNGLLERTFRLSKNHTNVKTEVLAGITTFMTMAYILAVNPSVLSSAGMDSAMNSFSDAMEPLLRLAESEKTAQLLAQEIERTRRRVNALENVMIPNYQETIKFIAMKLEENERASTTRLMKVKDMVLKKTIEEKRKQDEAAHA